MVWVYVYATLYEEFMPLMEGCILPRSDGVGTESLENILP